MTQREALSCLTELRAIERLIVAVRARLERFGAASEWHAGLVALTDRQRWIAYCLSLEDPLLIASVEERYVQAIRTAEPDASEPVPVLSADVPAHGRIH